MIYKTAMWFLTAMALITFNISTYAYENVAYTGEGKILDICQYSGVEYFWLKIEKPFSLQCIHLPQKRKVAEIDLSKLGFVELTALPDGGVCLKGTTSTECVLYDTNGTITKKVNLPSFNYRRVVFSQDGKYLASHELDVGNRMHVFNIENTPKNIGTVSLPSFYTPDLNFFTVRGKTYLFMWYSDWDATSVLFSVENNKLKNEGKIKHHVSSFDPISGVAVCYSRCDFSKNNDSPRNKGGLTIYRLPDLENPSISGHNIKSGRFFNGEDAYQEFVDRTGKFVYFRTGYRGLVRYSIAGDSILGTYPVTVNWLRTTVFNENDKTALYPILYYMESNELIANHLTATYSLPTTINSALPQPTSTWGYGFSSYTLFLAIPNALSRIPNIERTIYGLPADDSISGRDAAHFAAPGSEMKVSVNSNIYAVKTIFPDEKKRAESFNEIQEHLSRSGFTNVKGVRYGDTLYQGRKVAFYVYEASGRNYQKFFLKEFIIYDGIFKYRISYYGNIDEKEADRWFRQIQLTTIIGR